MNLKFQNVRNLFSSAASAEAKARERHAQAQVDAAAEIERITREREVLDQLANFQKRLTAYHAILGNFSVEYSEANVRRDYEAALDQTVALVFGSGERQALRLDDVVEKLNVFQNRQELMKRAEAFVAKLEIEVAEFVAENREVLLRHGASL